MYGDQGFIDLPVREEGASNNAKISIRSRCWQRIRPRVRKGDRARTLHRPGIDDLRNLPPQMSLDALPVQLSQPLIQIDVAEL
jgi:hypothetical protein